MRASDLSELGEALFGPRWQSQLAREFGVTDRTVRRWIASGGDIPPDSVPVVRDVLRLLVRSRLARLHKARKLLWSKRSP